MDKRIEMALWAAGAATPRTGNVVDINQIRLGRLIAELRQTLPAYRYSEFLELLRVQVQERVSHG